MPGFPFAPSRLDLAVEANSLLRGEANVEIKGVSEDKTTYTSEIVISSK